MAYRIMKILISNKNKTKEELKDMADVYYAAGRISKEQYIELIKKITESNEI